MNFDNEIEEFLSKTEMREFSLHTEDSKEFKVQIALDDNQDADLIDRLPRVVIGVSGEISERIFHISQNCLTGDIYYSEMTGFDIQYVKQDK